MKKGSMMGNADGSSSQFRYRRRFGGIACGRWDSGLRSAEQRGAGRSPHGIVVY